MNMNPSTQRALAKIGSVVGGAFLMALGGLLSKVLEPTLKWIMFTSMKLLIKILPPGKFERTVISLHKELKAAYREDR